MEPASPARLYATAVGALLVVLGVVGFFYGSSFGSPGTVDHCLGALRTNGWLNLLWIVVGALGLLTAGAFSRAYCLAAGVLFIALGVWGLALDPGHAILGHLPAAGADEALHLAPGILGLLAFAGTPRARPREGRGTPERTSPQFVGEGVPPPSPSQSRPAQRR
jgi:hypothetical protein